MTLRFSAAMLIALSLSACGRAPEPAPDPAALERFIAKIEEQDRAERAVAIARARRDEKQRMDAAEKRIDRYRTSADRVLSAPATAEGAFKALAGG